LLVQLPSTRRPRSSWRMKFGRTFPSHNDCFAGCAMRMGELQAEAYKTEHGWNNITIVRPANVYGPYDKFDSVNVMVVPFLIKCAVSGEAPMVVWGDGSAEREFIHAYDVARGILMAVDKAPGTVLNLASGYDFSIQQWVETVVGRSSTRPKIIWDNSKPWLDCKRIMAVCAPRPSALRLPSLLKRVSKPLPSGIRRIATKRGSVTIFSTARFEIHRLAGWILFLFRLCRLGWFLIYKPAQYLFFPFPRTSADLWYLLQDDLSAP